MNDDDGNHDLDGFINKLKDLTVQELTIYKNVSRILGTGISIVGVLVILMALINASTFVYFVSAMLVFFLAKLGSSIDLAKSLIVVQLERKAQVDK